MALNAAQNDGGGGRRGGAAGIPGGGGSGFRGQGGGGAQSGLGDSGCATASCLPFFRDSAHSFRCLRSVQTGFLPLHTLSGRG